MNLWRLLYAANTVSRARRNPFLKTILIILVNIIILVPLFAMILMGFGDSQVRPQMVHTFKELIHTWTQNFR